MPHTLVNEEDMDLYECMRDELLSLPDGLTNEELSFLDSLNEWIGCYTVRQAEWLQKIYDNVTA